MSRRPDRTGRPARQTRTRRLSLEMLEGRELLTLFTVTSAADNGNDASPVAGSLRAEIKLLNADTSTVGADTIQFLIPGSGVQTIDLTASLPAITHTVAIDGTTQAGYLPNDIPQVVIDGSMAGSGVNGLTITSGGGSEIRGLSIVGFTSNSSGANGEGIFLAGPSGGNFIYGDYLGIEPDGSTAKANASGILVFSAGNVIGGSTALTSNVISGNSNAGVVLAGSAATGNVVVGNSIGTNAAGTTAVGNQFGVLVMASGNTIGGTAAGLGNVISGNVGPTGNSGCGIIFEGAAINNLVEGNLIGTNRAGTSAILATNMFPTITYSNAYGIYFGSQGDTSSDNFVGETVGGSVAGAGNLISGNFIGIYGNVASSVIQGNTIGLNLAGTVAIPNNDGILMGASLTTIGGTSPLGRNIISGNVAGNNAAGTGLDVQGDSDLIQGNFIGLTTAGVAGTNTGNVVGMILTLTNSTIGSTVQGASNLISGNSSDAIDLAGDGGDAFYGNVLGLDINLNPDGNGGNGITIAGPTTPPTTPLNLMDSIGGTASGQGNTIAHSGGFGVNVTASEPDGITNLGIRGNSIFANALLGINTQTQNPTTPIPTTLFLNGFNVINNQVTVTGVYFGAPSTTVAIDIFAGASDASGYGQGPVYLGTVTPTTNATGFAIFTPTFTDLLPASVSFSATSTGPDGNTSEFSANYQTAATAPVANLVLQSTGASSTLVVGNTVTLTETVYNLGPNAATGVVLYDSLPASLVNGTVTSSVGSASIGTSNLVSANLGTLPSDTFATVTITATVSTAGTFIDNPGVSSTVFDPNYLDNTASQTLTVTPGSSGPTADLAILESVNPGSALVNSPLTYTITVGNIGPNTATNATVFDVLPVGTTLVGVNGSQGTAPSIVGTGVTVNLGTIAPGATATITIVVTPTAAGSITNTANVSGNQYDPVSSNNHTTLTTAVTAGIPSIHFYLSQYATTATGIAGQQQGFILTFENFGPDPATNVILNDALPTNATYVKAIPSQGGPPTLLANGLLSVNFGTVAAGAVETLQLILIPKTIGTLTNFAGVYTPDVLSATPSYASASVSIIAGPSVSALNGFGNNSQLVISFNEALNVSTATNLANYQLVAMGTSGTGPAKTIKIASITYNSISHSVMILPAQALDPKQYYKITVIGSTASGITDTLGRKLASTVYGTPGGNFSALFYAGTLPQI